MATVNEISEAIKSIEQKKQNLHKSFQQLQNHSQYLSSFTLTWPQIDSHFSQIQSSLQTRFSLLQPSFPKSEPDPENPFPQKPEILEKIKEICQKMEGQNLMNWVKENCNPKFVYTKELGLGLKWAPDPYKLVLDGIEGAYPKGKSRVVLLEGLMMVKGGELKEEERERAKKVCSVWREKIDKELNKSSLEIEGFLRLLCCFGLVEEIGEEEVFELVYSVANDAKAPKICRGLGLEERIPDLVQKLINSGKQHMAIKFVYEFKLKAKFPPTQLLKAYLKKATKAAENLRKGKNAPRLFDQANEKEISALRTVLNCIGAYKLASEYPPESIIKRIKILEELKAKGKGTVSTQPSNPIISKQKPRKNPLQARGNQPGVHANPNLAAGSPSSMSLTYLPLSQPHYMRPPISHLHVSGSQLPSSSYNMPNPVVTFGFPPPHHPSSHP